MSHRKQAKRARFYARQRRLRAPFTLAKMLHYKRRIDRLKRLGTEGFL